MDHNTPTSPSTAADVMTSAVVSVSPDTSVREVAALLLEAHVSAVPVVDGAGVLLGMASEGDLLGRSAEDRLAGQEWWLAILSAPGQTEAAITAAATARPVRDVMHAPVITVAATAPISEVAELLRVNGIKRVPVMRDGRMVGIVSRADLLRAIEAIPDAVSHQRSLGGLAEMIGSFFGGTADGHARIAAAPAAPTPAPAPITAEGFRHLVAASDQSHADEK